ncbi:hypothetical protein [Chryseobacterium sp. RLHN22]|uniref:hypothetical protein n=1 Tax=Chryseobacterium sp. RLHN22 TaxID=3437885 RepID=UPI003D9BF704
MIKKYKVPFIINYDFAEDHSTLCIWCKKENKKNIAHILSKSILISEHNKNKLFATVCENCNSFFGKNIEDWIFKYSPLNYWISKDNKGSIYLKDDRSLIYKQVFLWLKEYNEWFISTNIKGEQFPPQLIFKEDGEIICYNYADGKIQNTIFYFKNFADVIERKDFTTYLSDKLPFNFNPRIIIYDSKYIVVGRDKNDIKKILDCNFNYNEITTSTYLLKQKQHKELLVLYKWSVKKYLKFCAKISFEFLSLFKGPEFVLNDDFDGFRQFLFHDKKDDFTQIPFLSGEGLVKNRLTVNGWVSICDKVKISKSFQLPTFLLPEENKFSFSLVIYKVDSYLCASMKLFEIEVCNIILAQIYEPLGSIYYITYSPSDDCLCFYEGAGEGERIDKELLLVTNEDSAKLIN